MFLNEPSYGGTLLFRYVKHLSEKSFLCLNILGFNVKNDRKPCVIMITSSFICAGREMGRHKTMTQFGGSHLAHRLTRGPLAPRDKFGNA